MIATITLEYMLMPKVAYKLREWINPVVIDTNYVVMHDWMWDNKLPLDIGMEMGTVESIHRKVFQMFPNARYLGSELMKERGAKRIRLYYLNDKPAGSK